MEKYKQSIAYIETLREQRANDLKSSQAMSVQSLDDAIKCMKLVDEIEYYVDCHNKVNKGLPESVQAKNDENFITRIKELFKE